MAHPQHQPTLDGFDRLTVRLYRLGHTLCGLGFWLVAATGWLGIYPWWGIAVCLAGAGLSSGNVHLYDKRFRWLSQVTVLLGLFLVGVGALWQVVRLSQAGFGFCLVSSALLAFKEWFCFRIPGLRLMPGLLAVGVLTLAFGPTVVSPVCFAIAGVLQCWLAFKKWQMPLGHDIGDKSFYQV